MMIRSTLLALLKTDKKFVEEDEDKLFLREA
jgi:hypothetical protein